MRAWVLTETVWCQSRGTQPLHRRRPKPGAPRKEMAGDSGRGRESGAEGSVLTKVGGVWGNTMDVSGLRKFLQGAYNC